MKIFLFFICFHCVILSAICQNSDTDWIFYRENNGVQVFYKPSPNTQLNQLKLISLSSASVQKIALGITCTDSFQTWAFNCIKAEVVKRISTYDFYYHYITDSPWPFDDRDMVIHMKLSKDSLAGIVTINTKTTDGLLPEIPGIVRVKLMIGKWVLTPVSSDSTQIEYSIKMDLGGKIPIWLMNYVMDYGSVNTMNSLKAKVEKY